MIIYSFQKYFQRKRFEQIIGKTNGQDFITVRRRGVASYGDNRDIF